MGKLIIEFERKNRVQEPAAKLCSYLKNSTKFYLSTKNERNRVFFIHNETKILVGYSEDSTLSINEKHLLRHFKNRFAHETIANIVKIVNKLNVVECKNVHALVKSQYLYYVNLFRYEMDIIIKI